jgi:hypothetical protein
MKVKELIEELKKLPEEYLERNAMVDIVVIEEDGRIAQLINTSIKCVDGNDEYPEDNPEAAPEKPPKYYNDGTMFFDRFLRGVQ